MKRKIVTALGYDLSTTALSLIGETTDGKEVFVSVPMRGATKWLGQPAFHLDHLPGLFLKALNGIIAQGFEFAQDGVISGSVRQHDMVLLGNDRLPLIPALSWQCDAATEEVEILKARGAEKIVGRLEPRLILPKLIWALEQDSSLAPKLQTVMSTGDFIAMHLTGAMNLSSSEALSNGLLDQRTRKFATKLIDPAFSWFPEVIKSGQIIPPGFDTIYRSPDWEIVQSFLPDWRVVAGLGDNHAGAVGSGLADRHTIVVSAGTSGTVVRACKAGTPTIQAALKFEYYKDTLLLLMLADCASWYDRFVAQYADGASHAELDALALKTNRNWLLPCPETPAEPFPYWFRNLSLGEKVRSVQHSIAHALGENFARMSKSLVAENDKKHSIRRVVLTGGLTGSKFFCQALKGEIQAAGFKGKVFVSSRSGPLANQAAVLGALINAMVGGGLYRSIGKAIEELCPVREI